MDSTSKKTLVPEVCPSLQIQACADTLVALLSVDPTAFDPQTQKTVWRFIKLCQNITRSSECKQDTEIAAQLVRTVVGVLDVFIMDEMQPRYHKKLGGKVYGRAGMLFEEDDSRRSFPYNLADQPLSILPKVIVRYHYTFCREMPVYFDKLAKDSTLVPLPSIREFKQRLSVKKRDRFEVVYFTSALSMEEIKIVIPLINSQKILLVLPFCLNEKIGGFALLGNRVAKTDEKLFLPQSEPSRQDVLEALLRGGIPLIYDKLESYLGSKTNFSNRLILNKQAAETELKRIWQKLVIDVSQTDIASKITVIQAKTYALLTGNRRRLYTIKHQKELLQKYSTLLLSKSQKGKVPLYLTRTGLSATILGVKTAVEYFKQTKSRQPLIYINKGFYYEADILVKRSLTPVNDYRHEDARVFCTNVSSNPPFTTADIHNSYVRQRDAIINHVIYLAKKHPQNAYFLIIDKTTDLLFQTLSSKIIQPANLYLFEIASLTKYRRGDHNHFAGIVVYKGNLRLLSYIEKGLEIAHGRLSERDIHFFQSLTVEEVKKTINLLNGQADVFINSFNRKISELPLNLQWRIERNPDSPHYVFLIPPMRAMVQTSLSKGFPHSFYRNIEDKDGLTEVYRCHKLFLKKIVHIAIRPFRTTPGFERGSSFGLETTRVTFMPGEFVFAGQRFSQKIPRISFGFQTSLINLDRFATKLAEKLIKCTRQEITPLIVHPFLPTDQQKVKSFILRVSKDYGYHYNPKYHLDLDDPQKHYLSGGGMLYVLKDGEKVCGTIAIARNNNQAELKRFYVSPNYQNRGYGSQLLDKVVQFCHDKQIVKIKVASNRIFKKAHLLYQKKGFIMVGEDHRSYYFEKKL